MTEPATISSERDYWKAKCQRVEAKSEQRRRLLQKHQWEMRNDDGRCMECDAQIQTGLDQHRPDCRLAAAIMETT